MGNTRLVREKLYNHNRNLWDQYLQQMQDLVRKFRQSILLLVESSKVEKKRQILNFLFSNLEMKDKKAILTLRESFDRLACF